VSSLAVPPYPEEPLVSATVLVVEDDPGIRSLIVEMLEDEGFTVATVENGSDAVMWIRGCQPALVLLDLQLPKIRGENVLQVLQALYCSAVPVITMTALPWQSDAMRQRGACAHLTKPFLLDDMLAAVHAYL
jgi:two-component system response regulator (stage 0 sporulation protein F)